MPILLYSILYVAFLWAGAFALWRLVRRTRFFLHIAQLEGYKPHEYAPWVRKRWKTYALRLSYGVGAVVLGGMALLVGHAPYVSVVSGLLLWGVAFASSRLYRQHPVKKPLVWTDRMRRLAIATAFFSGLPAGIGGALMWGEGGIAGVWWLLLGLGVADLGAPVWVWLALQAMRPVEAMVQEGFKRKARRHLASRPDLKVVALTGSYGKTSVKFILAELLRQRYEVLATPSSFNTPMGICVVINQHLKPHHQVLVLEMGMRYAGDIGELCAIARPEVALVTTVGVAHLETMGTIEAIAREKGSLLKHMKPGGIAVLNGDNVWTREMQGVQGQTVRVSVDGSEDADFIARDVRYTRKGVRFTVVERATGEAVEVESRLLGAHNVLNVLLGIATARAMGLRLRQIAHAVPRIQPVEHRLKLRDENGLVVIDDAFNSNPVGARGAVDVLSQMEGGQRIIVTPGMVELGDRQADENRAFGAYMASRVDWAVLVGPRQTAPIQEGLLGEEFSQDRMVVVRSLKEAQQWLAANAKAGDVVLYENDLPDQYAED